MMRNGVIPTVSGVDWPPHRQSFFHAQVIAVDGVPVDGSATVYEAVAAQPAGTPIRYTLRKDGHTYDETVRSMQFTLTDYLQTCGVLLLFGCAWLAFALTIGFMQPHTSQARVYLAQGFVAGLYPIAGIFLHRPDFPLATIGYFALECIFPATWIHLALVFPVARPITGSRRLWLIIPYALSAALAVAVLLGFFRDPPVLAPLHATYLYAVVTLLAFVASLIITFWRTDDLRVRLRIKAVLPGAILAGTLALLALLDSAFSQRALPVQFGLLLTPAFSACVAYAIAKHDLFDIDRVIRQSFVYATLSLAITALYAAAVTVLSRSLPGGALVGSSVVGMTMSRNGSADQRPAFQSS